MKKSTARQVPPASVGVTAKPGKAAPAEIVARNSTVERAIRSTRDPRPASKRSGK